MSLRPRNQPIIIDQVFPVIKYPTEPNSNGWSRDGATPNNSPISPLTHSSKVMFHTKATPLLIVPLYIGQYLWCVLTYIQELSTYTYWAQLQWNSYQYVEKTFQASSDDSIQLQRLVTLERLLLDTGEDLSMVQAVLRVRNFNNCGLIWKTWLKKQG